MKGSKSPKKEKPDSNSYSAKNNGSKKDFLVVGIGASAGGIKPLREFFAAMPADCGMAFVVVLHLSPEHESQLDKILQTNTAMPVIQVRKTLKVEPNHVYVIPPAKNLVMINGVIKLTEPEAVRGSRVPIDLFFRTLAEAYGKNGVCVILSGTGADGTSGLKRVKEAGGIAIVQNPVEAEYDGMPRSAIGTNLVDMVLPTAEMPEKLLNFKRGTEIIKLPENVEEAPSESGANDLSDVLAIIKTRTGHDFTHYKHPTLLRRIARRLQVHGLENTQSYLKILRENPEEAQALLRDLLISVTNFFRDKEAFAALENEIIPRLFEGKTAADQVRVWCVGCSTGEEAFSLAILLRERADQLSDPPKIQIFASDIDETAIAAARESRYDDTIALDVTPERLRRFFDRESNYYLIKKEIREMILFAPHNILHDPPFSRQDLITCRNLMIYLNRQTQIRVLEIFHFALVDDGYLFLGASESAETVPALFAAINKKQCIYKMRPVAAKFQGVPAMPVADRWRTKVPDSPQSERQQPSSFSELHYNLVERFSPPSVLVNENHDILHLSENAGRFLRFTGGEPTRNIGKVAHPALRSDLLAALFAAKQEKKVTESRHLKLDLDGEPHYVNLTVHPIETPESARGFYLVIFDEIKPEAVPEEFLQKILAGDTDAAMETVIRRLEADLQGTKERLSLTIEQNEISVEELKASNEELQAVNEELRSATEELETSKEEMQSVNEELTTVNQELKEKIDEVSRAHSDLQNLMSSTDIGTIFLDRALRIKRFTMPVQNVFNIIPGDVGRPIEHITHRLDYKTLIEDAQEVMQTLQTVEREVRSNNDRWYIARFVPYRTADDRIDGVLLTFVDFTERRQEQTDIRFQAQLLDTVEQSVIAADLEGIVIYWNRFAEKLYGWTAQEAKGRSVMELTTPETTAGQAEEIMSQLRKGKSWGGEFEVRRRDGATFPAQVLNSPITDDKGNLVGIVGVSIDISERKQAEEALRESAQNLERQTRIFDATLSSITDFNYIFDKDGRFVYSNQPLLNLLGITLEEISGKNFFDLNFPEDLAAHLQSHIQRVFETGETVKDETPFTSSTGASGFYEYIFSPVVVADGAIESVAGSTRDITTRKRLETNLGFLAEISRDLTKLSGIDEIMRNVGAKIGAYLDLSNCALIEVNETEDAAVVNHAWHRPDAPELRGVYRFSEYLSDEFQKAGRAGENFIINDTQTDSRADAAAYARIKIGSFLAVPVLEDDEWRFMLIVYRDAAHVWQTDEIELMNDLTKRVWARLELARADEALRESEEKYRQLFDSMDEGFCVIEMIFDENEKPIDYRFIEMNPVFEQQTGLAGAAGKMARQLIPNLEERWFKIYGKVALTGEAIRFEEESKPMNRWFDVYASRVGGDRSHRVALVFNDITTRKLAEEKLREAGEFNSAVLSSLSAQIAVLDADGGITAINEAWRRFALENGDEYVLERTGVGVNYLEVCRRVKGDSADDARQTIAGIESVLQGKVADFSLEYPCHSPVEKRWFLLNVTPLQGGRNGAVVSHLNITTRRLAEEARRKSEQALKDADRRKDEFLATLAHELRNPLAPIRSGLEIIRRATADKSARMAALGIIERQTAQMVHLVDDLLDISRITQGKIKLRKTRFELKEAIDMALESSRDMLEMKGHELIITLPDEPVYLNADFTRITQILLNILNNSVKYTKPGGEIRLTAEKRDGEAMISFLDTGIGIPPEMLPRIFEMFSQIENTSEQARGGLGIGLSVVKRLVEMHNGTITAFSAGKGKGSEFVVRLPLAAEQSAKLKSELPSAAADIAQHALLKTAENGKSGRVGQKRILVVDDNADAAQMLEVLLKLNGHEVRIAFDGETGLAVNEEFQPEAALLDIGLPGISGYETARRIREKNPGILLIAVSGWGAENDRLRSSEAGFNYHLVKPVELGDLEKLLSEPAEK